MRRSSDGISGNEVAVFPILIGGRQMRKDLCTFFQESNSFCVTCDIVPQGFGIDLSAEKLDRFSISPDGVYMNSCLHFILLIAFLPNPDEADIADNPCCRDNRYPHGR